MENLKNIKNENVRKIALLAEEEKDKGFEPLMSYSEAYGGEVA